MGTGYTRNDTANNIADGNIINAADLDGEFDAIESAFNSSTGHTHDGTSAEGGAILVLGPSQEFVASGTEVKPSSNAGLSLGTSLLQFNDLYVDGKAYIDGLGESILVDTNVKIQFRDTALFINSSADGQLDIEADTTIELTAPTVSLTNDLKLKSDAAVLSFGADDEITVTHVHNTGLDLKNATGFDLNLQTSDTTVESGNLLGKITFNAPDEASGTDAILVGASIEAEAEATFDSATNSTALVFKTNTTGAATERMRLSSAGDLHFLDNRKAIFGAGSDLQIYHDGSNSYIDDAGTGRVYIRSNDAVIGKYTGETSAKFTADGAVELYHDDNKKLATTATGIDVTGTVTADGLTGDSLLPLNITAASGRAMNLYANGGTLAAKIASTGDISFYEDTGTTAKFFWDASAESLGIGTSSPNLHGWTTAVTLNTSSNGGYEIGQSGTKYGAFALQGDGRVQLTNFTSNPLTFQTNNTERMRIEADGDIQFGSTTNYAWMRPYETTTGNLIISADNGGTGTSGSAIKFRTRGADKMIIEHSGNVGIGTSSPSRLLDVNGIAKASIFDAGGEGFIRGDASGELRIQSGTTATTFRNNANNTEYMRIDSSGNVGIGTTSPDYKLEVEEVGTGSGLGGIAAATATAGGNAGYRWVTGGTARFGMTTIGSAGSESLRIYDNNNSSERMRIDSSGRVGIGTSSPAEELHVETTGGATAGIQLSTTGGTVDRDWKFLATAAAGTFYIQDATASVNRLAIDTSGNVGIGTSSPVSDAKLTISDTNSPHIYFQRSSSGAGDAAIGMPSSAALAFYTPANQSSVSGLSEAMRIDSSGNLLVGTTTTDTTAAAGFTVQSDGQMFSSANSQHVATMTRLTDDGDILTFRRSAVGGSGLTTVGSIGADGGYLYVGSNGTGSRVIFDDVANNIRPWAGATTDLGRSTTQFKDLYLSGGVYLGGTGAANKLDDYEEGTWTPVVQGSSTAGSYTITTSGTARYVKVGNLATVFASINNITQVTAGSGYLQIAGLPFTKPAATYASGSVGVSNGNLGFTPASLQLEFISTSGTSNVVYVYAHRDNATSVNFQIDDIVSGTTDIRFSITYQTG